MKRLKTKYFKKHKDLLTHWLYNLRPKIAIISQMQKDAVSRYKVQNAMRATRKYFGIGE
jgi:hypothetical protein